MRYTTSATVAHLRELIAEMPDDAPVLLYYPAGHYVQGLYHSDLRDAEEMLGTDEHDEHDVGPDPAPDGWGDTDQALVICVDP